MKKLFFILIPLFLLKIDSMAQVELGLLAGIDNGRLSGDKYSNTKYKPKTTFSPCLIPHPHPIFGFWFTICHCHCL